MGPLEDAIREHLELMRRRGADPAQIARAEAEALSPATREVEAPQAHADSDDLIAGTAPVPSQEPLGGDDDSDVIVPFDDEPHVASAAAGLDEEVQSVDQPTAHFDTLGDSDTEAEVAEEDEDWDDPTLHSGDADSDGADQDFLEDDGDDEEPEEDGEDRDHEPATGAQSDDVLEETPDFLAETPDHDKLWFEQSGPRDFDFDDEAK